MKEIKAIIRPNKLAVLRDALVALPGFPGLPVIEVHRVALTFGDKPVEYRVSTINTQHHDYVSVLSKTL